MSELFDRVDQRKISDLIPDDRNANKGTERGNYQLTKSLEDYGAGRSVLVDKNGRIIAGNQTAAKFGELGLEDVLIVKTDGNQLVAVQRTDLDLDDPKARALALADNRVGEVNLSWDAETLSALNEEGAIDLDDWFTPDELDNVLDGYEPDLPGEHDEEQVAGDLGAADTGTIQSRVKSGEIWACGRHRIACGDSTDEGNIEKLLDGDKVGFVWADPPYGMNLNCDFSSAKSRFDFAEEKSAFGGNKYPNVIGDDKDFDPTFFLKAIDSTESLWWGADYYAESIPDKNDGSWLVWDKRVEDSMDAVYGSAFETCWSKKRHKREIIRIKWAGIFGMEKEDTRSRVHPTQKPVALAEWCFEKYGKSDDLIFDPFLGSGMSIIAAQQMPGNRTVYGFELSPDYCEVILRRYEKLTGEVAELAGHL